MAKKAEAAAGPNKDWQAECDVRTLMEAEKIKADKPRHRRAVGHARKQMDHLKKVHNG